MLSILGSEAKQCLPSGWSLLCDCSHRCSLKMAIVTQRASYRQLTSSGACSRPSKLISKPGKLQRASSQPGRNGQGTARACWCGLASTLWQLGNFCQGHALMPNMHRQSFKAEKTIALAGWP